MKTTLERKKILIKQSPIHGYGVFADEDFEPNETIEECHMLLAHQADPALANYYFEQEATRTFFVPLGAGALYNHADKPNAKYQFDMENRVMEIYAGGSIKAGDEIFISYGKDWFSSRKMTVKPVSLSYMFRKHLPFVVRLMVIAAAILMVRLLQQ
jgi:hypothetical protein